jgi:hypothetical protein
MGIQLYSSFYFSFLVSRLQNRRDCSSDNVLDLYSGGARFVPWPRSTRLPFFTVFFSPTREVTRWYLDQNMAASFPIFSNSQSTYHSMLYHLETCSVVKVPTKKIINVQMPNINSLFPNLRSELASYDPFELTEQSLSWESNTQLIRTYITVFTRGRHRSKQWTKWIQLTSSHPIYLRFILITSSDGISSVLRFVVVFHCLSGKIPG